MTTPRDTKAGRRASARRPIPVKRIISGGQTGVDRAALDVALALGVPCGGWCPRGRRAEDGRIPDRYPLKETVSAGYSCRTEWNVRDSDGTLILAQGSLSGGTLLTKRTAERLHKPCLVVDLSDPPPTASVRAWLRDHSIRVLNVAGPRAEQAATAGQMTRRFMRILLSTRGRLAGNPSGGTGQSNLRRD